MIPLNWSELTELHDPLHHVHDCAYSACLDCLIFGGKITYPLGIYTPEEREALERSDDKPDEIGAASTDLDVAIKRRYGLAWHIPTEPTLLAALSVPGRAFSVGGSLGNFPDGYRLRRWDPTYTGGHRIAWLTTEHTWLDPLAPWKYSGEAVSINDVLRFIGNRAVSDLRYVNRDEYATSGGISGGIDIVGLRIRVPSPAVAGTIDVKQGTPALRVSDGVANPNGLDADATNRDAYAADVVNPDGSTHATGYVLNLTRSGVTEGWFIDRTDLPTGAFTATPLTTVIGFTQADLDAAKVAGGQHEWDREFTGTAGAKITPLARP